MKKLIIFIVALFLVFTSKTTEKEVVTNEPIENYNKVSLIAVGDNLIHETIYKAAKTGNDYNFIPMYRNVKALIQNYDLSFINQETILGGKNIGLSTYPSFNSPFELGDALIDTGFNLISIANNHTLDRGEKAIYNSINYWENQPVIYSGSAIKENYSQVKIFNTNGIKFAFVAYTYGTNGIEPPLNKDYLVNLYSNKKAKSDITRIKNLVDVIIVSMHWGDEYQDFPNELQMEKAKYLSDLGVDIIIGHHPHVIQPIDIIKNDEGEDTLVIYSLGNFLSDQKGIDRLLGMAVSLYIYKYENKPGIEINNIKATLLYSMKDSLEKKFSVEVFNQLEKEKIKDYELYYTSKKALIQTYYKEIIVE